MWEPMAMEHPKEGRAHHRKAVFWKGGLAPKAAGLTSRDLDSLQKENCCVQGHSDSTSSAMGIRLDHLKAIGMLWKCWQHEQ